ncbi:MAG: replication-associated recombination protein A [Candidatus Methylacidiphilales bacterium]|nr:replication-associated recombination protein A [Candidatus Methylacidiphilales bacterium]
MEPDLFEHPSRQDEESPGVSDARHNLARRMRPRDLSEFCGQSHILAPGKLLHRLITSDRIHAVLFHGPPGTGKTSLAHLIARATRCHFTALNAVEATVADLRRTVEQAQRVWRQEARHTLLLIDEIHRFNKAQQDAVLPHVENGVLRLIGATTQNPFFSVNAALVSRMQLFEFRPHTEAEIRALLERTVTDRERAFPGLEVSVEEQALDFLARVSEGDARKAMGALEIAVLSTPVEAGCVRVTLAVAEESIQKKAVVYDRDGDGHYDTISGFIKCVRGSEPDAAVYLLAKMLHAGEDVRFIARRLVILASEDIGLADPQALVLATACQHAVEFIGLPEARIPLAETTLYLATAPKSNAACLAISEAMEAVARDRTVAVPGALKDAHYRGAGSLGHGKGYLYAHDHPDAVAPEAMMPMEKAFYRPTGRGYEKTIAERLERWREIRRARSAGRERSE